MTDPRGDVGIVLATMQARSVIRGIDLSDYQRLRTGTLTGVQPMRPDRTQSWSLRICASLPVSHTPEMTRRTQNTNARTLTTMR